MMNCYSLVLVTAVLFHTSSTCFSKLSFIFLSGHLACLGGSAGIRFAPTVRYPTPSMARLAVPILRPYVPHDRLVCCCLLPPVSLTPWVAVWVASLWLGGGPPGPAVYTPGVIYSDIQAIIEVQSDPTQRSLPNPRTHSHTALQAYLTHCGTVLLFAEAHGARGIAGGRVTT